MNLAQIQINREAIICNLSGGKCERLRDLGFCENLKIKKIRDGSLLICDICNCKIALSRDLAEQIQVEVI